MNKTIKGWKLFRKKKDGTITSLFINKSIPLKQNKWLKAEPHLTKGYAFRPGWHATSRPIAPHLSKKGRVWKRVDLQGVEVVQRPKSQGGTWYLAKKMRIL